MDSNFPAPGESTNGAGRSSNNNNSHSSGSRRSACDRCRAHKLRCVRLPGCDFLNEGAGAGLPACERCVKAGAECLHTIRTRQASIRWSGYERRGSTGSVSAPIVYQRPTDDALPPGASGHLYQDTSSRSSFRTPAPKCSGEGRATVTTVSGQHGRPSHGPRRQDNFHRPMTSDSSSVDLFAVGGDFPAMVSGGVDAGVKPNPGRSIPYIISDHDHGLLGSFSSLSHWPECDLNLTNIFGQDSSDHVASTKTSTPVVESNNNSKATRGPVTTERCETKDECLQRLTELTLQLLKCFSLTEDHAVELEDLLAYSPCGKTRAAEAHEEPETGKNMVGVLLESSQVFLDTLQRFKGLQTSRQEKQSSCSPPSSEYSYIDSPDEMEVFSNKDTADTHESLPTTHRRTENEDSGDGIDNLLKSPEALRCSNQKTAMAPSMLSPQQSGFFSMPTTFTIISCYMWLFRGYEAVFAAIHNALLTQKIQRHQCIQESTNTRHGKEMGPAILPDINMGGFGLNYHPHLQIEMLIHVSCQMLQRIESVLGIDPASRESCALQTTLAETQNGVLNLTSAPTLLHGFLYGADSDSDGEGPNSARLSLVHGIVKSIRHTLRGGRD
ncbi:C6 finger domain-containing protein [Colletotrichum tofieldiae]|uniref:C6 finger domain-containing protein n=1 Tax=Colletotrichum tofieldiae TaxID=708197 RepID=A0A166WE83_9PEZI|nr:C6 finger domain-containing protein [Colletotrichum tofieldiae]GKT83700.1 C6 finger domain-containing protein [Colletotrichum tofieldiae]